MPLVFRFDGFRFHIYSNEGDPREPIHIHVTRACADAKFWLFPEVEMAYNRGFDARTIRRLLDIVTNHRGEIEEAWHEYFG
jgi:hypothetical protein